MQVKLPYMATPGLIPKILSKIQEARRPDRFTQDFLQTKLGFSGGGARPIIPLLKRMGFLGADGTPTRLYDQFRNPTTQGAALAAGLRNAYSELFERNEYAGDLSREKLTALVKEITGLEQDSAVIRLIVSTFWNIKDGAVFDEQLDETPSPVKSTDEYRVVLDSPQPRPIDPSPQKSDQVRLNIGYTINLNLPETTNPDVFNAIFKSLKEHLLTENQ